MSTGTLRSVYVFFALAGVIVWAFMNIQSPPRTSGSERLRAHFHLLEIQFDLEDRRNDTGSLLGRGGATAWLSDLVAYAEQEWSESAEELLLSEFEAYDLDGQTLQDHWGTVVARIVTDKAGEPTSFVLRNLGPNGEDDGSAYDDVWIDVVSGADSIDQRWDRTRPEGFLHSVGLMVLCLAIAIGATRSVFLPIANTIERDLSEGLVKQASLLVVLSAAFFSWFVVSFLMGWAYFWWVVQQRLISRENAYWEGSELLLWLLGVCAAIWMLSALSLLRRRVRPSPSGPTTGS